MSDLVLTRITDAAAAQPCIALARAYFDDLVADLDRHCDVQMDAEEVEQIHADLIAEGPVLLADPGRVYLGTVDGEPAAVGALKPVADGVGEIKRLYVVPAHRGRGFGHRIFDQLIDDARTMQYRTLRLETFPFMEAAVAMYRAYGFVDVDAFAGIEGGAHGVAQFEVFMELDLT
ncbi:MAG: GNAT family N-acetyltransferase [Gaiellales bacterium]